MPKVRGKIKAEIRQGAAEEFGVDPRPEGPHEDENRFTKILDDRQKQKRETQERKRKLKQVRRHQRKRAELEAQGVSEEAILAALAEDAASGFDDLDDMDDDDDVEEIMDDLSQG
jgi:hypothetical protein